MKKRIITGLILGAAALVLIWFGGVFFAVVALICVCFALAEEYKALRQAGYRTIVEPTWIALGVSIPLGLLFGHKVVVPILMGASLITVGGVVFRELPEQLTHAAEYESKQRAAESAQAAVTAEASDAETDLLDPDEPAAPPPPRDTRILDAVMSLLPLYSIVLPGLAVVSLTQVNPLSVQRVMLLMLIAVPVIGDTAALFVGRAVGGPKLCPAVSPKKTVAGAIGGLAGSLAAAALIRLIGGLVCSPTTELPRWMLCMAFGLLGGIAGQLGDLFASMVKRHCGIKDFSEIFPGHGGMLDRLDSILFMAIILYCCRLLYLQ